MSLFQRVVYCRVVGVEVILSRRKDPFARCLSVSLAEHFASRHAVEKISFPVGADLVGSRDGGKKRRVGGQDRRFIKC
jgi:hypothetical protein